MVRRCFAGLLILCIAGAGGADAQGKSGDVRSDTVRVNRIVLLDPGISLGRAEFLFPSSPVAGLSFNNPTMMFAGDAFSPAGFFAGGVLGPRADLMSPLLLQREREKSLSSYQMVLGAMQAGVVGYLAIRHIAKYGPFR